MQTGATNADSQTCHVGVIAGQSLVYLGSGSTAGGLGSLVGKMSERSSITHSGREGGKVWLDTNKTVKGKSTKLYSTWSKAKNKKVK